jgi:hypothetical protein
MILGLILLIVAIIVVIWILFNWHLIFQILDNLGKRALNASSAGSPPNSAQAMISANSNPVNLYDTIKVTAKT